MKPIVLVDMDGVLADFDAALWNVITEQEIPTNCTRETQRVRFLHDAVSKEDRPRIRAIVEECGWFRNLPLIPGAREGLRALEDLAEVWICSKPLEPNRTCRDDKANWIEEHLGPRWVDRLILAPDKSLVRGDILLDDAPKPSWYARASWTPVIFPTIWNGSDSKWAGLPCWSWGQDPLKLLSFAKGAAGKAAEMQLLNNNPFPFTYA